MKNSNDQTTGGSDSSLSVVELEAALKGSWVNAIDEVIAIGGNGYYASDARKKCSFNCTSWSPEYEETKELSIESRDCYWGDELLDCQEKNFVLGGIQYFSSNDFNYPEDYMVSDLQLVKIWKKDLRHTGLDAPSYIQLTENGVHRYTFCRIEGCASPLDRRYTAEDNVITVFTMDDELENPVAASEIIYRWGCNSHPDGLKYGNGCYYEHGRS